VRNLNAAIEERDAVIGRHEETICEQQAHIESLRQALEQAKFKTGILERSYSTQLQEARERGVAAERSAGDQKLQIAELEASHKALTRELAEARSKLDLFGPEEASIDEMLTSFSTTREQPFRRDSEAQVDAPVDPQTLDEMLPPDVMLAGKKK
jgi:predicted  nucleic acid-binding Zn-ribbon protein